MKFTAALTLMLIAFKILGYVEWSWLFVWTPYLIWVSILMLVAIVDFFLTEGNNND